MNSLKEYRNLNYLSHRLCYRMFALFLVGLGLMILSFGLGFVPGFSFDVSMILLLLSFGFALLFFLLWIIFSIRGKTSIRNLTPTQICMIDGEILTVPRCENLMVTSQALVSIKSGLVIIPLTDVLRVYPYTTTEKYNHWLPIWKHSSITVCCRSGKQYEFHIKNTLKAYLFIRKELQKYKQNILFDYDLEWDIKFHEYRKNI